MTRTRASSEEERAGTGPWGTVSVAVGVGVLKRIADEWRGGGGLGLG
jgi:hypothetical protein